MSHGKEEDSELDSEDDGDNVENDSDNSEEDEDKTKESNKDSPVYDENERWVEYQDSLGRTRIAMKKDLPSLKSQDIDFGK